MDEFERSNSADGHGHSQRRGREGATTANGRGASPGRAEAFTGHSGNDEKDNEKRKEGAGQAAPAKAKPKTTNRLRGLFAKKIATGATKKPIAGWDLVAKVAVKDGRSTNLRNKVYRAEASNRKATSGTSPELPYFDAFWDKKYGPRPVRVEFSIDSIRNIDVNDVIASFDTKMWVEFMYPMTRDEFAHYVKYVKDPDDAELIEKEFNERLEDWEPLWHPDPRAVNVIEVNESEEDEPPNFGALAAFMPGSDAKYHVEVYKVTKQNRVECQDVVRSQKLMNYCEFKEPEGTYPFVRFRRIWDGTFAEQMEMQNFPFDCQDLTLEFKDAWPAKCYYVANSIKPNYATIKKNCSSIAGWQFYRCLVEFSFSKKDRSNRRFPTIMIRMKFARLWGSYVIDMGLPLVLCWILSFYAWIIPMKPHHYGWDPAEVWERDSMISQGRQSMADRMEKFLFIICTAVAVAGNLSGHNPNSQKPMGQTFMDKYLYAVYIFLGFGTIAQVLGAPQMIQYRGIWMPVTGAPSGVLWEPINDNCCKQLGAFYVYEGTAADGFSKTEVDWKPSYEGIYKFSDLAPEDIGSIDDESALFVSAVGEDAAYDPRFLSPICLYHLQDEAHRRWPYCLGNDEYVQSIDWILFIIYCCASGIANGIFCVCAYKKRKFEYSKLTADSLILTITGVEEDDGPDEIIAKVAEKDRRGKTTDKTMVRKYDATAPGQDGPDVPLVVHNIPTRGGGMLTEDELARYREKETRKFQTPYKLILADYHRKRDTIRNSMHSAMPHMFDDINRQHETRGRGDARTDGRDRHRSRSGERRRRRDDSDERYRGRNDHEVVELDGRRVSRDGTGGKRRGGRGRSPDTGRGDVDLVNDTPRGGNDQELSTVSSSSRDEARY